MAMNLLFGEGSADNPLAQPWTAFMLAFMLALPHGADALEGESELVAADSEQVSLVW